jgi:hypothetical protein
MTEPEDPTRYTAPPDPPIEEPTFTGDLILQYVSVWLPMGKHHAYSLEEVRDILLEAAEMIGFDHFGINAL